MNALAARNHNNALLVHVDQAEWASQCLSRASMCVESIREQERATPARMYDSFWPEPTSWLAMYRPYQVSDGTLTITVSGILLHDFGYLLDGWATGYTYIAKAFERGIADPEVKRIALVINSGGGEVAGNFDLADRIAAWAKQKPVKAFVNESALSAAYSLAAATGNITMPKTGLVGSIGVVTSHTDMSGAMEKHGVKVTLIHAGAHKVDGNPYEALDADTRARIQARIDSLYGEFVASVARHMNLSEQAVRETEALTFGADEALARGLVHAIAPHSSAKSDFTVSFPQPTQSGANSMSEQTQPAAEAADLEKARADGFAAGAKAERERIAAILQSDEAQGRAALASYLAMRTDQSAEAAVALLAVAPKEAAPEAAKAEPNGFLAAMERGNPDIGASMDVLEESPGARLLADYRAAIGL